MLKKFLIPSFIILLSISLVSCTTTTKRKKLPGDEKPPEEQIVDICKKNPTADVCVDREGRTERKVLYLPATEWLIVSGTGVTALDKTNSSINADDQVAWGNGWVVEVGSDYTARKITLQHKGNREGQKPETDAKVQLTEAYYDQDGKLFSTDIHKQHKVGDTHATGIHAIGFLSNSKPVNLNVDFATTSKIFEMMTYEFDGQKYYVNGPPIYIEHVDPS